jgi:hypothetical protein
MFRFGHNETTWRPFVEQSSATTYAVFVPKEYRLVKEHNKDYDRILNHLEFIVSGRNSAGMGPHNAPTSMHTSGTGTTGTNTTNTTTTTTTTTTVSLIDEGGSNNMTIGNVNLADLHEILGSDSTQEDVMIVNVQADDGSADDCQVSERRVLKQCNPSACCAF